MDIAHSMKNILTRQQKGLAHWVRESATR